MLHPKSTRWNAVALFACASLLAGAGLYAQSDLEAKTGPGDGDSSFAAAQQSLAEDIVAARESLAGRSFDPAYRSELVGTLSSLPLDKLNETLSSLGAMDSRAVGDSAADLVFTPVAPCRIVDTRVAGGRIPGNSTREFKVTGSGLDSQGGLAAGCGIPFGPATAVAMNIVAVTPDGPGNIRAFPWVASATAPLAAVMNFGALTALPALANGVIVPICDPAQTTCTFDVIIQADANAVDVVIDVSGYYSATNVAPARYGRFSGFPTTAFQVSNWWGMRFRIVEAGIVTPAPDAGRLEVTFNDSTYGTVCDDSFDDNSARAVCRMMGYTGGTAIFTTAVVDGTGSILLDDIVCPAGTNHLLECTVRWQGTNNCSHFEDVGVACTNN